jgi:hypothetical protein
MKQQNWNEKRQDKMSSAYTLKKLCLPSSEPSAQSRLPLPTRSPVMQRGCPHKQVNSQGWQSIRNKWKKKKFELNKFQKNVVKLFHANLKNDR